MSIRNSRESGMRTVHRIVKQSLRNSNDPVEEFVEPAYLSGWNSAVNRFDAWIRCAIREERKRIRSLKRLNRPRRTDSV